MLYRIAHFFATVCYVGKIPFAPGTWGSLVAFPICYLIMYYTLKYQVVFDISGFEPGPLQFISLFLIEIFATIVLFITGTFFTSIYIKNMPEKDPSEVVIDEVVGQMLTILLVSFSVVFIQSSPLAEKFAAEYIDFTFLFFMPFVLFRIFDIIKPWPIDWLDRKIKGALGVMIDDVAAAFFASTMQYVIVFLILGYYK